MTGMAAFDAGPLSAGAPPRHRTGGQAQGEGAVFQTEPGPRAPIDEAAMRPQNTQTGQGAGHIPGT